MRFTNRSGTPVDPVPFFVVCASVVAIVFSFGPAYLLTLKLSFATAIGVCVVVCLSLVGASYHRLVWHSRPEHRSVVPAAQRLERLFYAILTGMALVLLLSLPLVLG